jgi:hypothetical protein
VRASKKKTAGAENESSFQKDVQKISLFFHENGKFRGFSLVFSY